MKTYNVTLQGHSYTHAQAVEWARGFVFSECELTDNNIRFKDSIGTANGVEVWYDFGADYYFFSPEEKL